MRWFKHLSRSHLDERMSRLVDECGLEGYGFYWLLLEVVAESMDNTGRCELTHPLAQWSRLLYSHHHRVAKLLSVIGRIGLAEVYLDATSPLPSHLPDGYLEVTPPSNVGVTVGLASTGRSSKVRVIIPNLLKYRDEYSKKSGQTPDEYPESVRSKIERQNIDTDTDNTHTQKSRVACESDTLPFDGMDSPTEKTVRSVTVKPSKSTREKWFREQFWPIVWAKIGTGAARNSWLRKVETEEQKRKVIEAAIRQGPMILHKAKQSGGSPIHASTWLNQERYDDDTEAVVFYDTRAAPASKNAIAVQRGMERVTREMQLEAKTQ